MDPDSNDHEPRSISFGRTSSTGSSVRRHSLSLSRVLPAHTNDDRESEIASEAGDIGDRALHRRRASESGSLRSDSAVEDGLVLPSQGQKQDEEEEEVLLPLLDYLSCLTHLAVFGILGALTRYLLQKLFGPGVLGATSDGSIWYLDLPSNMVGSFLMGWLGVVFKKDISRGSSEHLAIGLTTGYLGSLTTFSGWNQKMLELSVDAKWAQSFLGFFMGMFLAGSSIVFGVRTAELFKSKWQPRTGSIPQNKWRVDTMKCHLAVMVVMMVILGILWAVSGILLKEKFKDGGSEPELWLGCIVGPIGVWIRWFLARLNGRGLGKAGSFKWFPFGTFIANVSASCIMAALATVKKEVNTKTGDTIATGIQFGLMGCLSTVSTFVAEFYALIMSGELRQAYTYAAATMVNSFGLGILIYNVPVWTQ